MPTWGRTGMTPTETDSVEGLRAELARAQRRIEVFKSIGRVLGSGLDLDTLLTQIVPRISDLLDAERSSLFLVDFERRELWSKVLEGSEVAEIRLPFGRGLAGWVAEEGRPICSPDVYADARFNHDVDSQTGFRTGSALVWPLRRPSGRELVGVLQVLNKKGGPFDHDDERLLEAIASELAMALESARLYGDLVARNRELERTRRELELLFETERAITQSEDLAAMLASILETARGSLAAKAAVLWLYSAEKGRLECAAAAGLSMVGLAPSRVVREALRTDRAVRARARAPLRRGRLSVGAVLAVPIRAPEAEALGALELMAPQEAEWSFFDAADERAMQVVADQAGRALAAERRRAERAQSERLTTIGSMLSGIVHDLRTPLMLISGYADRLEAADQRDDRRELSGRVRRQVDLVSRMTRELLAYARGDGKVWRRRVRLEVFDREMAEYLEHEYEGTGIEVRARFRARGEAWVDDAKLGRLFANIARNARQAMTSGGRFEVSSRTSHDYVEYVFKDTGPGISPDLQRVLFDPFTTAKKDGGTGLGLAMVKQIVDDHGGSVRVQSKEGAGATFRVRLPRTES